MRSADEIVKGVAEWALNASPLIVSSYDFASAEKSKKFPDVMADLQHERMVKSDSRFPHLQIQQVMLNTFDLMVSVMVDNSDEQKATRDLRQIETELKDSMLSDLSLGDRVHTISPFFHFDLTLPYVKYPDGVKGREMRLDLAVAEPITMEDF